MEGSTKVTQTVWLRGEHQRRLAHQLIDVAPQDAVVKISAPKRSEDQNAKMWAMLSDISRSAPEDRHHIPEVWKCIFMAALGHEVMFTMGLNNQPFPIGFKTSNLNKAQMSDLIEFIYAYGAQNNVKWSEKYE
jgi:hypothetical protein